MGEIWVETDYETEGVRALEMTAEQLRLVSDDPYRWKWALIALHNALQAFLVHACSGSDLMGAMTQKSQREWYEAYQRGEVLFTDEGRLTTMRELMERARQLKRYVYTRPLPANAEQDTAVERLGVWRNRFVHYKPGGLTIEVSGFPNFCGPCLDVIEFLAFESGHIFTSRDEFAIRTEAALKDCRSRLAELRAGYG